MYRKQITQQGLFMQRHVPLRIAVLLTMSAWLLVTWVAQTQVTAVQSTVEPLAVPQRVPRQQECTTGPDLQIQSVTIDPDPPAAGQPYNVHVEIINTGTVVTATVDSWTGLYFDNPPPPTGSPSFAVEVPASTGGLDPMGVVVSHLTVPGEYATAGSRYIWIALDVRGDTVDESSCLPPDGEDNNLSDYIRVFIPGDATPTPVLPTPTPFPPPEIYFFNPGNVTILRGESVTLHWQAHGDSVSVTLDGAPVPLEDAREAFPTENHVYTLRAQNPGGSVERTCFITVVDPTATPQPTATPCALATIHEFNATKTTIIRGEETTLYWDLSGATEAFLNGSGVSGVAQKTVKLEQTTVFELLAHNACGDVKKTLKITVRYATPTPTRTPTRTPTPTYTPRPTSTPTRRVLPTPTLTPTTVPTSDGTPAVTATPTLDLATPPTLGPQTPTITPGVTSTSTSSAFDSPVEPETVVPTNTATEEVVATETPTLLPTSTSVPTQPPEPVSTKRLATVTPTQIPPVGQQVTPTPRPTSAPATITPTPEAGAGTTMRMYLCPLGILIAFSVIVLALSIVLPRIRERREEREALLMTSVNTMFGQEGQLPSRFAAMDSLFSAPSADEFDAPSEIDEQTPDQAPDLEDNGSESEPEDQEAEPERPPSPDATPEIA